MIDIADSAALRNAHLNLMTDTLLGLNWDDGARPVETRFVRKRGRRFAVRFLGYLLRRYNVELTHRCPDWRQRRETGLEWPAKAWTMVGAARLKQLRVAAETVLARDIPGDFLEAGVWRGGASILLRSVLQAYGDTNRKVWCADSFCGLPKPDHDADAGDDHFMHNELAVSLDDVKENFRTFSLLDDQVEFLPGWFHETLPHAPVTRLSLLRLDGDMYGSTKSILDALYTKVSPGGFVIVDDFCHEPCRRACFECLAEHGHSPEIHEIDHTGVFWNKPE